MMGLPKGEEEKKGTEEIELRISLKLISDPKPQIQEAQRTPSRINAKKTTSRHIIFRLQKNHGKEKLLKERETGRTRETKVRWRG